MTAHPHGARCYACADPAGAAHQLAAERAELDLVATRAREHRAHGEALDARAVDNRIAGRDRAAVLLDQRALQHLHLANALASGALFGRAHLNRVVAAHPALRERLEAP